MTTDDAKEVLEELLDTRNQSCLLGVALGLQHAEVESIEKDHPDPRYRLLHVITTFLKGVEPRPTWRVIVDALKNPIVNQPALAQKVEAAHFPNPTATHDVETISNLHTGMYSV